MAMTIEFIHAAAMVLWVLSLPLLLWHRWPGLSKLAAIYTISFIVINRVSHWLLGECILTRAARWAGGVWDNEWFTVKASRFVFDYIPSNRQVVIVEQACILVLALGAVWTLYRARSAKNLQSSIPS